MGECWRTSSLPKTLENWQVVGPVLFSLEAALPLPGGPHPCPRRRADVSGSSPAFIQVGRVPHPHPEAWAAVQEPQVHVQDKRSSGGRAAAFDVGLGEE